MMLAVGLLVAALTSAQAVETLLNTSSSCGPRKFAEARQLIEEEAKAGKPLQQYVYGLTVEDRAVGQRFLDDSRDRIRQLAEKKDNSLAWYLLSMEKNDLRLLKRAADGGNVQALNALGAIVTQEALQRRSKGATNDVARLLKRSFGYFSQAASMRDPNGLINLGTCYLGGFGCTPDLPLAFECFKSAAELGHPEGMDYMSACYEKGDGVPKDDERSLYWRMRGRAARGDAAAEKWLRERK